MSDPIGKGPLGGRPPSAEVAGVRRRRRAVPRTTDFNLGAPAEQSAGQQDRFVPEDPPRAPEAQFATTSLTAREPKKRRRRAERRTDVPTLVEAPKRPQPPAIEKPPVEPSEPARRRRRSAPRTAVPQLSAPKAEALPKPQPVAAIERSSEPGGMKLSDAAVRLLDAIREPRESATEIDEVVRPRFLAQQLAIYWRSRAHPLDLGKMWGEYADLLAEAAGHIEHKSASQGVNAARIKAVAGHLESILATTRFPGLEERERYLIGGLVRLVIAYLQHAVSVGGDGIVTDDNTHMKARQHRLLGHHDLMDFGKDEVAHTVRFSFWLEHLLDQDDRRTRKALAVKAPQFSMPTLADVTSTNVSEMPVIELEAIPAPEEPHRRIPYGYFNLMWPIVADERSRVLKEHLAGTPLSEIAELEREALGQEVFAYIEYLETVPLYSSNGAMQRMERMVDMASVAINRDPSSFENISGLAPELFDRFIAQALYAGLPLDTVLRVALPAYWVNRDETFAAYHETLARWPYADFADEAGKKGSPVVARLYGVLAFIESLTEILSVGDRGTREARFAAMESQQLVELRVGLGRVDTIALQDSFLRVLDNLNHIVEQFKVALHRKASQPFEGEAIERAGAIVAAHLAEPPTREREVSIVVDDGFAADVETFAKRGPLTAEMSLTTIAKAVEPTSTEGDLSLAGETLIARIGRMFNDKMDVPTGAIVIARALKGYWEAQRELLIRDDEGDVTRDYTDILSTVEAYRPGEGRPVKIMADEIDEEHIAKFAPSLAGKELGVVQTFHGLLRAFLYSEVRDGHCRFVAGEHETTSNILELARGVAWHAADMVRHLGLTSGLLDFTTKIEARIAARLMQLESGAIVGTSGESSDGVDQSAMSFIPLSPKDMRADFEAYDDMRIGQDHTDFPMPTLEDIALGNVSRHLYSEFLDKVIKPQDSMAGFFLSPVDGMYPSGVWQTYGLIVQDPKKGGALESFDKPTRRAALYAFAATGVMQMEVDEKLQRQLGVNGMKALRLMRFLTLLGWTFPDEHGKVGSAKDREIGVLQSWIRDGYCSNMYGELDLAEQMGLGRKEVRDILKNNIPTMPPKKMKKGGGGNKGGAGPAGSGSGGPPPIPDDAAETGQWDPSTGKRGFSALPPAGMTSWQIGDWTTHCMAQTPVAMNPVFFNNAAMLHLGGMNLLR